MLVSAVNNPRRFIMNRKIYLWTFFRKLWELVSNRKDDVLRLLGTLAKHYYQRAKKVVSDSPGLVEFAIGLVIFVLNLPDGQVLFFLRKFKLQKDCNQSCWSKSVWGLVEMTCGLVHASYSLPEWQAVQLTFFAPWLLRHISTFYSSRIMWR